VKNGSEVTLAGLVAVRITWITATVVCVVSILIGLLSGTNGGDSSEQFPGFAFSDGGDPSQQLPEFALFEPAAAIFGAEAQQKAQATKTVAAQEDRSGRTKGVALGKGHYRSGVPPRSGSHPQGADGRKPVVTSSPKPPRAPSLNPPKLPQGASEIPAPSPPPVSLKVSAPVQAPVTIPKISVGPP
jgi:hypothetical protein